MTNVIEVYADWLFTLEFDYFEITQPFVYTGYSTTLDYI